MAIQLRDSFNRADNALSLGNADTGQAWEYGTAAFRITRWKAQKLGVDGVACQAVVNVGVLNGDVSARVIGTSYVGLVARYVDTNNFILAQWLVGSTCIIYSKVAGVFTQIFAGGSAITTGDIIALRVVGTTFTVYVNGASQGSVVYGAGPQGTRWGLNGYSTADRFDDVVFDDLLVVPATAHTLENIVAGLAVALDAVPDLRVYPFPADQVEAPAAVLTLPDSPYSIVQGRGESFEWTFPLWLLVAKTNDRAAAAELRSYLEPVGPKSILAAIEVDQTLGGSCDSVQVQGVTTSIASVAGTSFLAAEFTLEVVG